MIKITVLCDCCQNLTINPLHICNYGGPLTEENMLTYIPLSTTWWITLELYTRYKIIMLVHFSHVKFDTFKCQLTVNGKETKC